MYNEGDKRTTEAKPTAGESEDKAPQPKPHAATNKNESSTPCADGNEKKPTPIPPSNPWFSLEGRWIGQKELDVNNPQLAIDAPTIEEKQHGLPSAINPPTIEKKPLSPVLENQSKKKSPWTQNPSVIKEPQTSKVTTTAIPSSLRNNHQVVESETATLADEQTTSSNLKDWVTMTGTSDKRASQRESSNNSSNESSQHSKSSSSSPPKPDDYF